ncbi:MAG: PrgI family protein [Candidatus Jorgensenbacteria bacterium]|nr:PrgI family protein [Candidatus Jorgensenbacteria bacterium]
MAEFQVPQFIEEKPKIVGPLTIVQFLYIGSGAAISLISYSAFNTILWLIISIIVVGISVALAFVKVNGQDLPVVALSAFQFIWGPRKYTWQRAMEQTTFDTSDLEKIQVIRKNISIQDKIKSIALGITTGSIERTKAGGTKFQSVTYITGEHKVAKRVDY